MAELKELVGFDYAQVVLELSHRMTFEDMAERVGYANRSTLYKILRGATPDHRHGEALYALYCDILGKKPPLTVPQRAQYADSASARTPQGTSNQSS